MKQLITALTLSLFLVSCKDHSNNATSQTSPHYDTIGLHDLVQKMIYLDSVKAKTGSYIVNGDTLVITRNRVQ